MRKFYSMGLIFLMALAIQTKGQNSFSFNCARDTSLNICGGSCFVLKSKIPDIRSGSSGLGYAVNPTSGGASGCFRPYIDPGIPGNPTSITLDDRYSQVIDLGYTFNFYGSNFTQLIASGNGYLSFNTALANTFSHWSQTPGNVPNTGYDGGLAMGVFHDIDPSVTTSPNRRIKYDIVGSAPHRKFILSFYKIPLFSSACNSLIENTHQIVLYEGLNIVEIFVNSVQQCPSWNQGRKMIGLQSLDKTKGIMAPGRTSTGPAWGSVDMNESWRFVPLDGPTLYRGVELYDLSGTLISTGDTTSIGNSTFEVSFPNVCPNSTTTYIVKSKYENANVPGTFVYGTDTVRAIVQSPLSATSSAVAAGCPNNNIGSVTITPSGAAGPFEYSIDNGATWQTSNTFNAPAGTYTVLVREIGSTTCTLTLTVTIPQDPTGIVSTYAVTDVLCNGASSGSISISPSGGSGIFEYSIDGGTTYQPTGIFNNLPPGSYLIRIRDNQGCIKDTTVNITEPTALNATAVSTNATCTQFGSIEVSANGGTPGAGYTYSVDGVNYQSSNIFSLNNGTYPVTVQDQNGCTTTAFTQIVELTNDLTLDTRTDTTICLGASIVLTTSSSATLYSWTGTDLSSTTDQSPVAAPTTVGIYPYTVTGTLGQCTQTDQVNITVEQAVTLEAGQAVSIIKGETVQFNASATGADTYLWTSNPNDASLTSTTILNPSATPLVTTTYTITAVNNQGGCRATDEFTITVIPYCIKVNNAFTPNGDGINEVWLVYDSYDCLKNVSVNVFNRYGSKVYENKDYRNNWDGRYKGKSLPDATYYAVIEFTLVSGKKVTVKTDLTILR